MKKKLARASTINENYAYLCRKFKKEKFMLQEIGKWLLDISKYVITSLVLTRIYGGLPETWTSTTIVAIIALAVAAVGFYLNRKTKK
jgi:hypothetical protein